MPGLDSLIGQEKPASIINGLLRRKSLPHALLLTGIDGVGRAAAATALAMACNCTGETDGDDSVAGIPCGQCRACAKIQSGKHPDILDIRPSGAMIKVEQIRQLLATLTMKPFEARCRMVIIHQAQKMNVSAANALLKALEEPPAQTHLILIANRCDDLLPTIVSRCQQIRFNPIPESLIAEQLNLDHGNLGDEALVIARMAQGSLKQAKEIISDDWRGRRHWLLNEMAGIREAGHHRLLAIADGLYRSGGDGYRQALHILSSWYRDLIVNRFSPDMLINQDMSDEIAHVAASTGIPRALQCMSAIASTRRRIEANCNARLCLELLMFTLAGDREP